MSHHRHGFFRYISVPLRYPDGRFFGTLCAIDPNPARINTPQVVCMFTLFADLIGFHLDAYERLHASESALRDARRTWSRTPWRTATARAHGGDVIVMSDDQLTVFTLRFPVRNAVAA